MIGGFHAQDCVKRVGEFALNCGIDTIIDIDMTDFFFHLYKEEKYFRIEDYKPLKYKQYMINKASRYGEKFADSSPAYGFNIARTEDFER